jgi:valyl-tRNA synthetase
MSKSKGNVVTPIDLFDRYGSDAVRYWAAGARPGIDTAFSEDQMKVGRKLAVKLLNVTKFVLGFGEVDPSARPVEPLDAAMLTRLAGVVDEATRAFEEYDYARALERTEAFFWWFCDDYVELVKGRAYGGHGEAAAASARVALLRALSTIQRLFAPMLPFVTAETWSWWQDGSVHRAPWPTAAETSAETGTDAGEEFIEAICGTIAAIRRAKTEAKVSQRARVETVAVTAPAAVLDAVRAGWPDIADAGSVDAVTWHEGPPGSLAVDVALAPAD